MAANGRYRSSSGESNGPKVTYISFLAAAGNGRPWPGVTLFFFVSFSISFLAAAGNGRPCSSAALFFLVSFSVSFQKLPLLNFFQNFQTFQTFQSCQKNTIQRRDKQPNTRGLGFDRV